MIKRIRVIGVGLGSPQHLTLEAIEALASVEVFVFTDGESEAGITAAFEAMRAEVVASGRGHRVVEVTDPERTHVSDRDPAAYGPEGHDGMRAPVDAYADALAGLEPHEETVGFLVWGDPSVHDSRVRLVDALVERFPAQVDVIPGIGAAELLAARHRIALNPRGASVHVTTGARLLEEYDPALGDVIVILDGQLRCLELAEMYPDLEIHWGAHLGTDDEVLVAGRVADVGAELRAMRARAIETRGWVVDAYLLRRAPEATPPLPVPWPAVEALSDGVVTLRPVGLDDWPLLLAEHNDEESMRWAIFAGQIAEPEARAAAVRARRDWLSGRAARFVMVDSASERGAGMISVIRMGPPDVGVIGYGVLPEFRGRGFTTRALEVLVRWVFETTSIARLELGHKVGNEGSGVVAARAGFVREGVLAGRLRNADGSYSDEVSYARLRPPQVDDPTEA
jgi:precorrin-6A synthase (deacetylating)